PLEVEHAVRERTPLQPRRGVGVQRAGFHGSLAPKGNSSSSSGKTSSLSSRSSPLVPAGSPTVPTVPPTVPPIPSLSRQVWPLRDGRDDRDDVSQDFSRWISRRR